MFSLHSQGISELFCQLSNHDLQISWQPIIDFNFENVNQKRFCGVQINAEEKLFMLENILSVKTFWILSVNALAFLELLLAQVRSDNQIGESITSFLGYNCYIELILTHWNRVQSYNTAERNTRHQSNGLTYGTLILLVDNLSSVEVFRTLSCIIRFIIRFKLSKWERCKAINQFIESCKGYSILT